MTRKRRDKFRIPDGNSSKVSVDDALTMAIEVHQRGLIDEALSLYESVLKVVPEHPDALHFMGVARHQAGDSEAGLELIRQSLEIAPEQPSALNNLGNINKERGHVAAAESAYLDVLELAPEHVETLCNLAVVLRSQNKTDEAHAMIVKALSLNPKHGDSYHNLGNILRDLKRYDEALTAYKKSIEFRPENHKSTKSIARLLYNSGRKEESLKVLKRHLARNPDDAVARHSLIAYGDGKTPDRASDDYIRQTFDPFAASFDSVLKRLDYKAPRRVADLLHKHLGNNNSGLRLVDLGCGTGLFGALIRPVASSLVGVDLSEKMLANARARNVYDNLVLSELTQYLRDIDATVDVLTCVDTLVYFGALDEFSMAASDALEVGGWLFFSAEAHAEAEMAENFHLHPHGRYSHSLKYVEAVLVGSGFEVKAVDKVVLRLEREEPVHGMVVAAQKSASS